MLSSLKILSTFIAFSPRNSDSRPLPNSLRNDIWKSLSSAVT